MQAQARNFHPKNTAAPIKKRDSIRGEAAAGKGGGGGLTTLIVLPLHVIWTWTVNEKAVLTRMAANAEKAVVVGRDEPG